MTKLEREINDAIALKHMKTVDYNQVVEAYGLKMKRQTAVDINAVEADPRNAKTIEVMDKYPTLKKLVLDAVIWFNEIRIVNCVEKHFDSLGVASKKHREMDLQKLDEMNDEVDACAKLDGFVGPRHHYADVAKFILDLCPAYDVVK